MWTWFLLACALLAASASACAACEEGYSCCNSSSAHHHRCCPFEQAVCCADQLHCCPHAHRCDLKQMRCESDVASSPWFETIPVVHRQDVKMDNVQCNQTAFCHDGSTCCRTLNEQWGCCPLPMAVCCADQLHCCPHGDRCDLKQMRCESGVASSPWFETIPVAHRQDVKTTAPRVEGASDEDEEVKARIKCDASTSCPDLMSCCFIQKQQMWGCCPLPNAVCCPGGMDCCPQGYRCKLKKCVRGDEALPLFPKIPALTEGAALESGSRQCDETSRCPARSTCCRLPVGEWGCCPLHHAVCCSESGSCCPHGYSCSPTGACLKKPRFDGSVWKMLRSKEKDPRFM